MGSLASGVLGGLLIDTWGAAAPARFAGLGVAPLAVALPWLLGKGREPSREH